VVIVLKPHLAPKGKKMAVNELLQRIDEIDRIGNDTWIEKLEPRKIAELEFHNRDRDKNFIEESKAGDSFEKFYGNKKFYATTERSREYVARWIEREAPGKVFLDYACGNGEKAMTAAELGSELAIGFDISDVSVRNCVETAAERGLSKNTRFFQADAENTMLPDNSVDRVICSGMLHHLDLSYAFPELRRILKPGGKILAVEALDYNPAIKFYRMITPDMRTEWEKAHILSLKDVNFARRFFEIGEVRYWHVVGYAGAIVKPLARPLDALDSVLEKIPLLNRMAWTFTFELIKPEG
jgi:ubiquinone/menaquinone biosynthesis C-methylase UbiE